MFRILIFLLITVCLVSCSRDIKMQSFTLKGTKPGLNNEAQICFTEAIGSDLLDLEVDIVLIDGRKASGTGHVGGVFVNPDYACETISTSFTWKGSSSEDFEVFSNVYNGNVKSIHIKLSDGSELLDEKTFTY